MTEPYELPQRPKANAWIDRVRAADAEAERAWKAASGDIDELGVLHTVTTPRALIAIAAELRAARIARRPGAGR